MTLIIVSIITVRIADFDPRFAVGALDRTLGFVFGAARGVLLCVVAFLFFNWLVPEKTQPEWVREAKTRPFLQSTGDQLMAMLPDDPRKHAPAARQAAGCAKASRRRRRTLTPAPAQPARPPTLAGARRLTRRIAPNGAGIRL